MTVDEIKKAVDENKNVYWCGKNYKVIKDNLNRYFICYDEASCCVGLTWSDGMTLNGKEEEFFIGD